ncbi:hypothetical protein [Clostridium ljungdahlii]|uniref:Uncharacterized protein n=1 Tax=Clostridium ljungdahlii TaxID=1538 RepID=A0A166S1B1_9CLOT|nr:hypothetical protein [Clostridium ljungdahlii]OAA91471.1 hypothetical protein WY13_00728 [Clostridium ljungdahlii]
MTKNKQKIITQKGVTAKKYQDIFKGAKESGNIVKTTKTTKFKGGK